jgi:hypothetical protein
MEALCLMLLLIAFNCVDSQYQSSTILLGVRGAAFQPANRNESCGTLTIGNRSQCIIACYNNPSCCIFDYNPSFNQCRLFPGPVSTGTLIPSSSSRSIVGSLSLLSSFPLFVNSTRNRCQVDYNQISNRMFDVCLCPVFMFKKGSTCVNQVYQNSDCLADQWCRTDLNLTCDPVSHTCQQSTTGIPFSNYTFPLPVNSSNAAAGCEY